MSFNTKLTDLLKTNPNFVDDEGELLLAAVQDKAWKLDHDLIRLLLSDEEIKATFFDVVAGSLLFKTNTFIEYISQKNFLDNSYTRFRNRIGLTIDGKYLSERGEVSLAWAYKDCVLEGGQTKEEERREEIFFNEVLAQDEINRMFDPKVLTNFTRYSTAGEQPVEEFKRDENGVIRENLIIKGNNLIALHTLKEQYRGKVTLIYIDPPYNREEESFYNDNFKHSSWLTFMRNRIELAFQMLCSKGCILISIDDSEQAYLKILCDEVFGRENFLSNIAYERSGVSGLGQGGDFLVNTHESILCYAKSKEHFSTENLSGEDEFREKDMRRYNKYVVNVGDGVESKRFIAPSTKEEVIIYRHNDFNVETISLRDFDNRRSEIFKEYLSRFDNIFRTTSIQEENKFQKKILSFCRDGFYSANYLVSRGKKKGERITAYYYNGGVFVWLKDSAKISEGKIIKTNKLSDFWSHASIPKADLANEGGVKLRRGKKPENLLKRLILMTTEKNDIVLDFFTGSGTTCAVAHKMGRQYIGIEQLDYGSNGALTRLNNVINGDSTGISKSVDWIGGGDFIYCELMKYNQAFVDRIQSAENSDELLRIWQDMAQNSFLNWYINPKLPEDAINDFMRIGNEENGLVKQKKLLMELLDKNQLYVNLSEIDDVKFNVSEEDMALNKAFYGEN